MRKIHWSSTATSCGRIWSTNARCRNWPAGQGPVLPGEALIGIGSDVEG